MRHALLDVAQNAADDGGANGIFDEHDLEAFITLFISHETEREATGNYTNDFSRYDLNGDGATGGTSTMPFDLNVDVVPAYSTVEQTIEGELVSFNENSVSDWDVLCFYAYSELYQGDIEKRGGATERILLRK